MKKILTILALLFVCSSAFSQFKGKHSWMTGDLVFVMNGSEDNLTFMGGSCHEGGYRFGLKPTETAGIYTLTSLDEDSDYASIGRAGDIVKYIYDQKNAWHFLEVFHNGLLSEIVFRYDDDDDNLYDKMTFDQMAQMNGEYVDEKGQKYLFDYGDCILGNLVPNKTSFKFGEEYDTPSNIIIVGKNSFFYNITLSGMELYKAIYNESSDYWDKGDLYARLKFIDKGEGRFPWTSMMLINRSMVRGFDKKTLRIMRNEILARHGYNFTSKDLKDYFSSKDWYKPVEDNGTIKLSLGEQAAVELIKSEEATPDSERY
ncbi:MAG: YARHG domain-containing protein [Bacteroidales bacterium]|nr:YARHG domain-containing protein [Bacteroidales bacterium]